MGMVTSGTATATAVSNSDSSSNGGGMSQTAVVGGFVFPEKSSY